MTAQALRHSIGIETRGGVLTPLIEAGTPLPASHTEIFTTAADRQQAVEIVVYEGDAELAVDNRLLGRLELTGLRPALRGALQIDVTFTVGGDGALDVKAFDRATGQEQAMAFGESGLRARTTAHVHPRAGEAKVFISYRRSDTSHACGRLFADLARELPGVEVFVDVDSVPPGADVYEHIHASIAQSRCVLVLMGREWMTGNPLRDPDDWVRLELEAALNAEIPIIPIRIDCDVLPLADDLPASVRPIRRLNAARVDHESWARDVEPVLRQLRVLCETDTSVPIEADQRDQSESSGPGPLVPTRAIPPDADRRMLQLANVRCKRKFWTTEDLLIVRFQGRVKKVIWFAVRIADRGNNEFALFVDDQLVGLDQGVAASWSPDATRLFTLFRVLPPNTDEPSVVMLIVKPETRFSSPKIDGLIIEGRKITIES